MAFEVMTKVDQRLEFVLMARQEGANVRALCRRFGISPDTGCSSGIGTPAGRGSPTGPDDQ